MAFTDLGSLGSIGSTSNNQSTLNLTTSAAIAAGDLVVVVVGADNIANGGDDNACSSVTLGIGGQALIKGKQIANALAAQAGASCSIWYGIATSGLASGGTIRATFGSSTLVDASAMTARKFSIASGFSVQIEGTPGALVGNTASDPGSLDVTTGNIACLRVRGVASQIGNNTNLTPTASWTAWANGNSATTGTTGEICARAESRIVTGTGAASNPTYVSAIYASVYVAFKEVLPPVEGTLAVTETADIAVFTSTLTGLEFYPAFAAQALNDKVTFNFGTTAYVGAAPTGYLKWDQEPAAVVNGTLVVTEAVDTAAFNGSIGVSGTLAALDVADVAAFAGSVIVSGTLAATEAIDVAALNGLVNLSTGVLAANEIGVGITNTVFPSNAPISFLIGNLFVTGIDTAAFNGSVGISGTLAVTEVQDVVAFNGTLPAVISGTLTANEVGISLTDNDFLANSPINTAIGTLSVVGIDTALFNVAIGTNGTLGVTEATDTALFNGQVIPIGITGALTVTEARDVAAFSGTVAGISGTLVVTEAKDVAAFAATPVIAAQLVVTDAGDTAAFNGRVGVSGTLDIVELPDVVLFNGYIGSVGILATTEAGDVANFTGSVVVSGTLAVTEAQDIAEFVGHLVPLVELFGTLSATEETDTAQFDVLMGLSGILFANEASDIAYFDASIPEEESPADFENWKFGKRFDRSLTSRFPWQG